MINRKSLVSAIIIFLNEERFLQEAIESVLAQTYDNWELLLVNDGSTDRSADIAFRYQRQYPSRIRCLEHEGCLNRGMSVSRNLGILHAKGEYIAFLDADDVWLPEKLEKQVNVLDDQPEAAMVFSPTQYWYGWTGKPEDKQRDFVDEIGFRYNTLIRPPELVISCLIRGNVRPVGTCSRMIRREIIDELGGYEDTFHGLHEDHVMLAKIYASKSVFGISDCLDRYRQHPKSFVAVNRSQKVPARLAFLRWLDEYLSNRHIEDTTVWHALVSEVWRNRHPGLATLEHAITVIGRHMLPAGMRDRLWREYEKYRYCSLNRAK